MKTGLVNSNGIIENIIVVDDINSYTPPDGFTVIQSDDVFIGRLVVDGVVVVPEIPPEPSVVPSPITATQMLIVLQDMGFITETEATDRSQFPTAFNALLSENAEQNRAIKIRWANLTIVERNDPLVSTFGSLLSLTSEQINTMFIQAAAI
ncbi:MAG: hypothetical protein ACK54Y_08170 [Bacteroidota bacterium]|jgi:hypothetical protein